LESSHPSLPPNAAIASELRETVVDLTRAIARLARNVETANRLAEAKPTVSYSPGGAEIRYFDTIRPPNVPRRLSWHEKVREKKVSLPAATGWTIAGTILFELGKALVRGDLHF
jgi:hypothetical protein